MTFDDVYQFVISGWLILMIVLFVGIVVWVFWPKRKKKLESHGRIPLDDDKPEK